MSFTLYNYVLSGSCYKVRLMAALLGVEYRTVAVDFHPGGAHKSEEMLAIHPAGTLPLLVAGDLVLSETQAMLVWLAQTHDASGRWFPAGDAAATAQVLEWLAFSAGLTATAGEARLHAILDRPVDLPAVLDGATRLLRRLEAHLTERGFDGGTWLVGDHPTVADIACFPYVALAPDGGLTHDAYPGLRNWMYAVRSLPGFVTMPGIHQLHELRDGEVGHG
jgi:glutathione S-transferase